MATITLPEKFHITPKRDFGGRPFLINGKYVMSGFVVTNGKMCNVMPGATWFQTIPAALCAIQTLRECEGMHSDKFWYALWDKILPERMPIPMSVAWGE